MRPSVAILQTGREGEGERELEGGREGRGREGGGRAVAGRVWTPTLPPSNDDAIPVCPGGRDSLSPLVSLRLHSVSPVRRGTSPDLLSKQTQSLSTRDCPRHYD